MKIRIDLDENATEEEIIIKCRSIDERIGKIQKYIKDISSQAPAIGFYKENQEYFFPVDKIIFFETDDEMVYAHTADDAYRVKFRLYELEEFLPKNFVRVSKSAILNVIHVYSVDRSVTASSLITFFKSHKQVYVSRFYYKTLKLRLDERRNYET